MSDIPHISRRTPKRALRFFVYRDENGDWRWTLVAVNGEALAVSSESYKNRADLDHAIDLIRGGAAVSIVREGYPS
jgi:uncharacterized protein YegP (UPF0339 family)